MQRPEASDITKKPKKRSARLKFVTKYKSISKAGMIIFLLYCLGVEVTSVY